MTTETQTARRMNVPLQQADQDIEDVLHDFRADCMQRQVNASRGLRFCCHGSPSLMQCCHPGSALKTAGETLRPPRQAQSKRAGAAYPIYRSLPGRRSSRLFSLSACVLAPRPLPVEFCNLVNAPLVAPAGELCVQKVANDLDSLRVVQHASADR